MDYAHASKATILKAIKRGMAIRAASKQFGVPVSGIVAWCKLAKIPVPAEFTKPRRQRSETPLSAGAMGRRAQTDR